MIENNQFINLIKEKMPLNCTFSANGKINQYVIKNIKDNCITYIPKGNDNFERIEIFLKQNNLEAEYKIEWVKEIRDKENQLLHYETNLGKFIDSQENPIVLEIQRRIENKTIEMKEMEIPFDIDSIEINVFLPRAFSLRGDGYPKPIKKFCFEAEYLEMPFPVKIEILQNIEKDFFDESTQFFKEHILRNINGNILRYTINKREIIKVFKWSKSYLSSEQLDIMNNSLITDYDLFKRKSNKGPRTQWCFDYFNLQNYIWVPILYITNRLIYLINNQVRDKTIGLLSKHKLGNMVCIRVNGNDSKQFSWQLSNLQDQQCTIFPHELNWKHKPLDKAIQRIRFLFDQGLYLEAIIVTQSVCESIVKGMFENRIRELKWEQMYRYLSEYFNEILKEESKLRYLLNGGLHKIYKYRNSFAHDYFEHKPEYIFNFEQFNEIENLLKPFIDFHENMLFLWDVDNMYTYKIDFNKFYLEEESKNTQVKIIP